MSFRINLSDRSKISARLIRRVHREIQKAFALRSNQGLTQQALADKLAVNRATVNKRLLGHDNLTLRSIADLAWAMDADIIFRIEPRELHSEANYYRPDPQSIRPKLSGSTSSSAVPTSDFTLRQTETHA